MKKTSKVLENLILKKKYRLEISSDTAAIIKKSKDGLSQDINIEIEYYGKEGIPGAIKKLLNPLGLVGEMIPLEKEIAAKWQRILETFNTIAVIEDCGEIKVADSNSDGDWDETSGTGKTIEEATDWMLAEMGI